MRNYRSAMFAGIFASISLVLPSAQTGLAAEVPEGVWVRPGYELTVVEDTITKPRFLQFGADGELYVSLPGDGEIKALRDTDGDGFFETIATFVEGHPTAHGMYWHDGWLWFTQSTRILKARDTNSDGVADEKEVVLDDLPGGGGHWWRSILIHNDRIYSSIGDEGNATEPDENWSRKSMRSWKLDGSDEKLVATGIRNTEKWVVRPGTDEMWGMDHNSDWYGRELEGEGRNIPQPFTDVFPGGELNKIVEGGFYGHPYIVGLGLPRLEFMDKEDIVQLAQDSIVPEWDGVAHAAANGMTFYTGDQFPDAYGHAFIAYHGSWNRSEKVGYCLNKILFEYGKPYGEQMFVKMVTEDEEVLGRPVDVVVAPDGSLIMSDDGGNKIYRLRYVGE